MNLNNILDLMANTMLDGSLTFIDKHNFNEVITLTQEAYTHKFIITFSTGSPVRVELPTFPLAIQYIANALEESEYQWEIDQRELDDMLQD